MRFFNTTGPVRADRHYCIPPLDRLDLDRVLALVCDERYFVLHDRDADRTWAQKVFRRVARSAGRAITVWGM